MMIMDVMHQMVQAMSFVKSPLSLIAFLFIVGLAALLLILKSTKGLESAQKLLLGADSSLSKGEFVKLFKGAIYAVVLVLAMLFALLAYNMHTSYQADLTVKNLAQELTIRGIPCYEGTCNGKSPQQSGCANNSAKTEGISEGNFKIGNKSIDVRVQLRYSPLCRSAWVKATKVVGAKLWIEDEYRTSLNDPYVIPDSQINDDYHTDMVGADKKIRACMQFPGLDALCTGYSQLN
jgi:hypothetical protein